MKTSSKIAIAAAAFGAWLYIKKKQSASGIGGTKLPTDYKRDFAMRYFEDHFYTLHKVMPIERFIDLWVDGKAKAMANGVIKLDGKKYKAPATNNMISNLDSAAAVDYYGIVFKVEPKSTQVLDYRYDDADYADRGKPNASTVFLHNDPKLNPIINGIGSITIPGKILNEAKAMFDAYDLACEIDREHDKACDAIYEDFQAQGIDPFADENERIVVEALYRAGLTDQNGLTDVMMNRHNARKELLNYINDRIITLFPIPA